MCFTRRTGLEGAKDSLSMTVDDLAALDLHPATLQYATRVTTESRFWSKDRSKLSKYTSLYPLADANKACRRNPVLFGEAQDTL